MNEQKILDLRKEFKKKSLTTASGGDGVKVGSTSLSMSPTAKITKKRGSLLSKSSGKSSKSGEKQQQSKKD